MVFVLAHFSDPHLGPVPRPAWGDLVSKRMLGYANWLRRRRLVHRHDILTRLVADAKAHCPDHIVITGDLTNLALPGEIIAARDWLASIAPPDRLTIVPGNHDAYVAGALDEAMSCWRDYAASDAAPSDEAGAQFPFIRRRGPVALIGLSTAVPTRPFSAAGRVDGRQIVRLADDLVTLSREGLFRIVLMHHPMDVTRKHWHKRLENGGTVRTVLTTAGAELVLNGHMHVPDLITIAGPKAPIHVFSVPSASADPRRGTHGAGYALHRIEDKGADGFIWSYERRVINKDGAVVTVETGNTALPNARA